jgi:hypothetical protein
MSIRVVEYGPFGCRLDRGKVKSFDEIHEGFEVVRAEAGDDLTVFVEPTRRTSMLNNVRHV